MTTQTNTTKPTGGARPVLTKSGIVAALIEMGFRQDEEPFPPSLKTVAPATTFTEDEMDFARYMKDDTDFGGCWNDAKQIDMRTAPDAHPVQAANLINKSSNYLLVVGEKKEVVSAHPSHDWAAHNAPGPQLAWLTPPPNTTVIPWFVVAPGEYFEGVNSAEVDGVEVA